MKNDQIKPIKLKVAKATNPEFKIDRVKKQLIENNTFP